MKAELFLWKKMRIMLLLLLLDTTLLTSALETSTTVIYVDPDNGTMDPNCWTGGMNLPCKDYDLAKEGALYLKVNVQIVPSKTGSCQQTWMYNSNGTCICGRSIYHTVSCNSKQVSILNCNCIYDTWWGKGCPCRTMPIQVWIFQW